MKCAVTGATGFLGSHMADFLEKKGHTVHRVKNPLEFPPKGEVDWIFHFAAQHGGVGYLAENEYWAASQNMWLDYAVMQQAEHHNARLFYPSSSCIYPTETGEPQGCYGYEKLLVTKLSEHAPFDMRVGILGTVYGPRQHTGEKAKFPVDICKKVLAAQEVASDPRWITHHSPLQIWGDGKQVRSFLYISDAIEMIYELMSTDSYQGPVNIASEEQVTVQEICDELCKNAGITPRYVYDTSKPSGAQERREDVSEWYKRYSYRPQTPAKLGFAKLYDHLKENSQEVH